MSDLPAEFRHIRLELAREPGHPQGSSNTGYDLVAPLTGSSSFRPIFGASTRTGAACTVSARGRTTWSASWLVTPAARGISTTTLTTILTTNQATGSAASVS